MASVGMSLQALLNSGDLDADSLFVGSHFAQQKNCQTDGRLRFFGHHPLGTNLFQPRPLFNVTCSREDVDVGVQIFRRQNHDRPDQTLRNRHQQILGLPDPRCFEDFPLSCITINSQLPSICQPPDRIQIQIDDDRLDIEFLQDATRRLSHGTVTDDDGRQRLFFPLPNLGQTRLRAFIQLGTAHLTTTIQGSPEFRSAAKPSFKSRNTEEQQWINRDRQDRTGHQQAMAFIRQQLFADGLVGKQE